MKLAKLFVSLVSVNQCSADAGAVISKAAESVGEYFLNFNPWAAVAVSVGSVATVANTYIGKNSLTIAHESHRTDTIF